MNRVIAQDSSSSSSSNNKAAQTMSTSKAAPALGSDALPPAPPTKDNGDPTVDFVIVFQAVPKKYLSPKAKLPQDEASKIDKEFNFLVKRLSATGLAVTSRESKQGTGEVLVFVKASNDVLVKIGRAESLGDYLHGVKTAFEPSTSSLSRTSSLGSGAAKAQAQTFSSAERVRHVYELITRSPKVTSGVPGAGVIVGSDEFPHVADMTPLHDPQYNQDWLKRWSNTSSMINISVRELDAVRSHFGEHIALYFGFLNFYFQSLSSIAAIGLAFWFAGAPFHPIYSLLLVAWSCVFVELWRMRERKLAVRWGTLGVGQVDDRRKSFKPVSVRRDPVTGEDDEVFEWWRRELRIVTSVPVMLFFAAVLGATMTTMFATEVFVTKLYDGPGKSMVPMIPTALFVVCVPQIMAAWQATASALTSWENHYSERTHESSLTLKMFALQAVTAYGALTLSAFIYIPFGQSIMDYIVSRGFFSQSIAEAAKRGDIELRSDGGVHFDINPSRMHAQLFAVLTTSQVINAFTEVGLPFILRKVNEFRESRSSPKKKSANEKAKGEDSTEDKFLDRVQDELELPPYDTFGDYAEMATQFGYIVLWSVIWPLAPVMGFINNFFELRSDALKISINARRPVPIRAESIGPWLEVLGFIAWLAAMSNSALVFLFQPSGAPGASPYETTMRTHLHPSPAQFRNGTTTPGKLVDSIVYPHDPAHTPRSPLSFSNFLPSFLPTSGTSGALIAALLVALASEHTYGVARAFVRHVLERALWRGSEEETTLRRREWESRRDTLARVGHGALPEGTSSLASNDAEGFYATQSNVVQAVQNSASSKSE